MISTVIMAGGKARRMGGKDKAFIKLQNKPILSYIIEKISTQTDNIVLNSNNNPVDFLKLKVFDYYHQLKPRPIPELENKPVMIIDIDEASLTKIGQWPWPRTKVAELIEKTRNYGASLIAFDMVFAEEDRLNPQNIAGSLYGMPK